MIDTVTEERPRPRIELEAMPAPRLEAGLPAFVPVPERGVGTLSLVLGGAAILAIGLAALGTANFAAAQFARSVALGWVTVAVAVAGFGLIGAGVWRELRGLFGIETVDRLRVELASADALRARPCCVAGWPGCPRARSAPATSTRSTTGGIACPTPRRARSPSCAARPTRSDARGGADFCHHRRRSVSRLRRPAGRVARHPSGASDRRAARNAARPARHALLAAPHRPQRRRGDGDRHGRQHADPRAAIQSVARKARRRHGRRRRRRPSHDRSGPRGGGGLQSATAGDWIGASRLSGAPRPHFFGYDRSFRRML